MFVNKFQRTTEHSHINPIFTITSLTSLQQLDFFFILKTFNFYACQRLTDIKCIISTKFQLLFLRLMTENQEIYYCGCITDIY